MVDTTTAQRLLVLTGPDSRHGSLIDLLKSQHEVTIASSMDAALEFLRAGSFDAVFSDSADFLPLERALASQQYGLILDTSGEGICITDAEGQILWANRRMKQWSEPVRDRIRHVCHEAWNVFTHQSSPIGREQTPAIPSVAPPSSRSRKFSFSIDETNYFELFCSPVIDAGQRAAGGGAGGITKIVAICWDATSGRRLQQK